MKEQKKFHTSIRNVIPQVESLNSHRQKAYQGTLSVIMIQYHEVTEKH